MSIFLGQSERYGSALTTFDPLCSARVLELIDPGIKRSGAPISWLRIALSISILFLPLIICSAIPSITLGGRLSGTGGLLADTGVYGYFIFGVGSLILIPISRRVLGDLIAELVRLGIVSDDLIKFSPESADKGPVLGFLEWLSRVTGYRLPLWFFLCLLFNINGCYGNLLDNRLNWGTSHRTLGSIFYRLGIGGEQPNIAGLWLFVLVGPIIGCLVVVVGRLLVVFACLCREVAANSALHIIPPHPDNTGGLKPVGQVALLLAVFSFLVGLSLAGITANEIVMQRIFHMASSQNEVGLVFMWITYLILGSALFLLPLTPLRDRMAAAKRTYLIDSQLLRNVVGAEHEEDLRIHRFRPEVLEGLVAIDALIEKAAEMAIWPFDRKTFMRYAGLLISPLAPVATEQLPKALHFVKVYLGIG
jgi:hypothetical protein